MNDMYVRTTNLSFVARGTGENHPGVLCAGPWRAFRQAKSILLLTGAASKKPCLWHDRPLAEHQKQEAHHPAGWNEIIYCLGCFVTTTTTATMTRQRQQLYQRR
jgi:hypothetical protein